MKREKILLVLLSVIASVVMSTVIVFAVYKFQELPENAIAIDKWLVYFGNRTFEDRGSFLYITGERDAGIYTYTATFSCPAEKLYFLVISRPAFRAFRVYVDGHLIGEVGDMKGGRSNVWNGVFIFPLEVDKDHRIHHLKIEGYALYSRGFYVPVFVAPEKDALWYLNNNKLWSDGFFAWATGSSILLALLLMVMVTGKNIKRRKVYLFVAIAMFFIAVVLVDNVVQYILPFSYLIWFKIVAVSAMLTTLFLHVAIQEFIYGGDKPWLSIAISVFMAISSISLAVLWWDPVLFNRYSSVLVISIPFIAIYNLWHLLKMMYKADKISGVLWSIFTGLLVDTILISVDVVNRTLGFLSPRYVIYYSYYGMTVVMVFTYLAIVYDYILAYENISREQIRAKLMKEFSELDPLTGVYNRRALERLVHRKGRLCFLMIDIDHFKSINDQYGHMVGDEILKKVVSIIRKHLRNNDILVRYGGEEFLVILGGILPDAAYYVAERIRKAIEEYEFVVRSKYIDKLHLTVSIGVCCGNVDDEDGDHAVWDLISRADDNLYRAKESGRNQVVSGGCYGNA